MSLLQTLNKSLGISVAVKEEEERQTRLLPALKPWYDSARVPLPTGLVDIFNAFKEDPAVFTAISAIGKAIGDIPFVLIEAEQKAEDRKFSSARHFHAASRSKTYAGVTEKWASIEGGRVIRHHDLLSILESPNPSSQLTGHMLKAAVVAYMELTGMAYIEKLYSKEDPEKLVGLWPLINPLQMMVVAGKTQLIDGYVWVGSTGAIVFKPEDMIYLRSFNPDNPFYGYSPTQVLRAIIAGDLKSINWNYVFFQNNTVPLGLIKTDQRLNDTDIDLILANWDDSHLNEENWHRPAVMGQGTSYQDIGSKHKDMDWTDLRRYSKEEILGAYGVPPIVAGDYRDANRASSDVMLRLFYENGILPRCDLIENMLNMALIEPGSGLRLVFDLGTIEALKGDVLSMAKVGARAIKQYWSANEIRSFLWNLPVIDDERANAIYDPRGENVIGHAPDPSEIVSGGEQ